MKNMLMIEEMEEIVAPDWESAAIGFGGAIIFGLIVIAVVGCCGC
jgi:hypothetical protein